MTPQFGHANSIDSKWNEAFGRKARIDDVLAYILKHWKQLQKNPPADMLAGKSEPTITKYFGLSLRKNARAEGITGYFVPENPVADIDEVKKELESRGRTDLTYYSDSIDPPLDFVFEFKKLKSKSGAKASRDSYYKEGALRFVNGIYGKGTEFGFMVALVANISDKAALLKNLQEDLKDSKMEDLLYLVKDEEGNSIVAPATTFSDCHFETLHSRGHLGDCSNILLGHVILCHVT